MSGKPRVTPSRGSREHRHVGEAGSAAESGKAGAPPCRGNRECRRVGEAGMVDAILSVDLAEGMSAHPGPISLVSTGSDENSGQFSSFWPEMPFSSFFFISLLYEFIYYCNINTINPVLSGYRGSTSPTLVPESTGDSLESRLDLKSKQPPGHLHAECYTLQESRGLHPRH